MAVWKRHANAIAILTLLILSMAIFVLYVGISRRATRGELVMPLDDTYIHFQYARQLASGQPYQYNPGDKPSSGATSFIYPYLLAPGYALGFTGPNLGYWALALGTTALFTSSWLIYLIVKLIDGVPHLWALSIGGLFALSGPISWHFMSGMETGLVIIAALATLHFFQQDRLRPFSLAAVGLALTRPEASIMAALASLAFGMRAWLQVQKSPHRCCGLVWLALPILAVFVQPLINLALTGSMSASGTQAKSILTTVPFFWRVAFERVMDNMLSMWRELITGTGSQYVPLPLTLMSIAGLIYLLRSRRYRAVALLIAVWFLAMTGAIATLDTAFWHFKRYQMPLMALQFALAGTGAAWIMGGTTRRFRSSRLLLLGAVVVLSSWLTLRSTIEFARLYRVNVENILSQPLPMARWLKDHTAPTARVAVHDVGMMRYIGNRYTIDMVGLTTPEATSYWRSGPGSVAEFLLMQQPDYVAAYTTARGLNYLADTSIYGDLIEGFTAEYDPADNVALGAEFQGIFLPAHNLSQSDSLETYIHPQVTAATVIDVVNVAELQSEAEHHYNWRNHRYAPGFATEVYEMDYAGCLGNCQLLDGGRLISAEESFTMAVLPNQDNLLLTRIHPFYSGIVTIYANNQQIGKRSIPEMPGRWLELATIIPAELAQDDQVEIRVVPEMTGGFYMPYRHMTVQTELDIPSTDVAPLAVFQESGAIELIKFSIDYLDSEDLLIATFRWQTNGQAIGDYKFFLHIYSDPGTPPLAQVDLYPNQTLLPGNWLPGVIIDTFAVDLAQFVPGSYQVAIGFYEASTLQRLEPASWDDGLTADVAGSRLFIGQFTIE